MMHDHLLEHGAVLPSASTQVTMQAQEVAEMEPDCKIYFAMTKCDLLDQPPGIGVGETNLEPSPQESGT